MDKPRKQRSCAPLTFEGAIPRLLDAVEIIKLRNYIKPHEKKLIQDAFALIDQPRKEPKSKADKRREDYRHFLKQVDSECGPVSVCVCALGLRKTVFGRMLEDRRLRLPMMVKKHKSDLEIPFLREVVQGEFQRGRVGHILMRIKLTHARSTRHANRNGAGRGVFDGN